MIVHHLPCSCAVEMSALNPALPRLRLCAVCARLPAIGGPHHFKAVAVQDAQRISRVHFWIGRRNCEDLQLCPSRTSVLPARNSAHTPVRCGRIPCHPPPSAAASDIPHAPTPAAPPIPPVAPAAAGLGHARLVPHLLRHHLPYRGEPLVGLDQRGNIVARRQLVVARSRRSAAATRGPGPSPETARHPAAGRSHPSCSAASPAPAASRASALRPPPSANPPSADRRRAARRSAPVPEIPPSIISRASNESRVPGGRLFRWISSSPQPSQCVGLALLRRTNAHVVPLHLRQQHAVVGHRPVFQVALDPVGKFLEKTASSVESCARAISAAQISPEITAASVEGE